MDEFIGVLTLIDFNEPTQEDCQFIIGSTSPDSDKDRITDEAVSLASQYLFDECGSSWKLNIENGVYGVRLDIVSPGDVQPTLFLRAKMAEIQDEKIIFQEV